MKRFAVVISCLALILIVLACVAWTQLPAIGEWALRRQLHSLGADDVRLNVASLSPTRLAIARLSFEYRLDNTNYRFDIGDIVSTFDWREIRDGRVHALSVGDSKIVIDSVTPPAGTLSLPDLNPLIDVLNVDLPGLLPLDRLSLKGVQVDTASAEPGQAVEVDLDLRLLNDRVSARLAVEQAGRAPLMASLLVDSTHSWTGRIHAADDATLAELTLRPEGRALHFEARADTKSILEMWLPAPHPARALSGWIAADGTLVPIAEDERTGYAATLDLQSERLAWTGYDATQVALRAEFDLLEQDDGLSFAIKPMSETRIGTLAVPGAEFKSIAFQPRLSGGVGDGLELRSGADTELRVESLNVGPLGSGSGLRAALPFEIRLGEEMEAGILKGATLSMTEWNGGEITVPDGIRATVTQPIRARAAEADYELTAPAAIRLDAASIGYRDIASRPGVIVIGLKRVRLSDRLELAATIDGERLILKLPDIELDIGDLHQSATLAGDSLSLHGRLNDRNRRLDFDTEVDTDLGFTTGRARLHLAELTLSSDSPLAQHIVPLQLPADVVTGSISGDIDVNWQTHNDALTFTAALAAVLRDIGGAYDTVVFSGASAELRFEIYPQIRTPAVQEMKIDNIDVGIPITETRILFSTQDSAGGDLPVMVIPFAQASLLGGRLYATANRFDPNADSNTLEINLSGLSLEEIVALHQLDDLKANGTIDGLLPLRLDETGVHIDAGRLYARQPGGKIVYSGDTSGLENAAPGTDIMFKALKNFNYTSLRAETDYDSSGVLEIGLNLHGQNPDLEAGRPIVLNVDLEQNVLKLLKSLRFVDGLNEAIDNRVQDYYRQRSN